MRAIFGCCVYRYIIVPRELSIFFYFSSRSLVSFHFNSDCECIIRSNVCHTGVQWRRSVWQNWRSNSKTLELGCLAFIPKRSRNTSSMAMYLPCCRRNFYLVFAMRLYTTSGIFLVAHVEGKVYSLIQMRVDNTTAYYTSKIVMYLWREASIQPEEKYNLLDDTDVSILLSRICLSKTILGKPQWAKIRFGYNS